MDPWLLFLLGCALVGIAVCLRLHALRPADKSMPPGRPLASSATVTVTARRPRRRIEPIIGSLHLTAEQRDEIQRAFDERYRQQHIWPDIKLEAFVDLVTTARPSRPVLVYFAQKRVVLQFAAECGLPWLAEMIHQKGQSLATSATEVRQQERTA
jgi:hypothetical protein